MSRSSLNDAVDHRCALTPREQEVAEALGAGLAYKDIARRLNITPATVASHAKAISRKGGYAVHVEVVPDELQVKRIQRRLSELTARELRVARAIAAGTARESIAQDLGISINTVRSHVRSILAKLGVATAKRLRGPLAHALRASGNEER